jgi:hypothetical protein
LTTLTLLTKIYNTQQLKQINRTLEALFEGLNVALEIRGTLSNKWVQVELSGEDQEIATSLLARETGFCPTTLDNIKKFETLKGFVVDLEKSIDELTLDIGVFNPKTALAKISLNHLQAQLGEGKKMPLKKIVELWGLSENLPLTTKALTINPDQATVEVELQPTQTRRYLLWRDSLLDRLLVFGASRLELESAVEQEGLTRDIIEIEALGMFEHALVCKLGTDATGLISRMGRRLRKAKFTVFNPRKIMAFYETPKDLKNQK